jgi:hypothetical protein
LQEGEEGSGGLYLYMKGCQEERTVIVIFLYSIFCFTGEEKKRVAEGDDEERTEEMIEPFSE